MAHLYVSNPRNRRRRRRARNPWAASDRGWLVPAGSGDSGGGRGDSEGSQARGRRRRRRSLDSQGADARGRRRRRRSGRSVSMRGRRRYRRFSRRVGSARRRILGQRRNRRVYGSMHLTARSRRRLRRGYRPSHSMIRARRAGHRRLHYVRGYTIRRGRHAGRRIRGAYRNPLEISNPIGGVPVLGTAVALIGPALFGALGVEVIAQAVHLVTGALPASLTDAIPQAVKDFLPKVQYTLGGLVGAGVVQMLTFIPAPIRMGLGLAMASAGGGVDMYRMRLGEGAEAYHDLELGDAGNWEVDDGPLGDLELGDLEFGDFAGDEDFCGDDMSVEEGEAAARGYSSYVAKYPPMPGAPKGMMGQRWKFIAAKWGPDALRDLARLPPAQRLAMIRHLKMQHRAMQRPGQGPGPLMPPPGPRLLPPPPQILPNFTNAPLRAASQGYGPPGP